LLNEKYDGFWPSIKEESKNQHVEQPIISKEDTFDNLDTDNKSPHNFDPFTTG